MILFSHSLQSRRSKVLFKLKRENSVSFIYFILDAFIIQKFSRCAYLLLVVMLHILVKFSYDFTHSHGAF